MFRFFSGAVQHGPCRARHVRRRLQQQRRLADAGLTAQEDERPRHDAAAEDAIELVDRRGQPRMLRELDVGTELRAG